MEKYLPAYVDMAKELAQNILSKITIIKSFFDKPNIKKQKITTKKILIIN
jgi:hypothetical protein